MTESTVVGAVIVALALAAFVVAAWKVSSWLTRRGHVVRPLTMMDHHMTQIEKRSAQDRSKQAADLGTKERH
nr:hypothetical protein [Brevundimonas naejangsanensis]